MPLTHIPPIRMPEGTTDASIIERSRDAPEWFSVIFDRYFTAIHRYAASRLGPGAADDVASETFLAAFDQRDRYDLACSQARAWLYGIATNLIGRHRRSEIRLYRALSRSATRDDVESHADQVADRVTAAQLSPELAQGLAGLVHRRPRRAAARRLRRSQLRGGGARPGHPDRHRRLPRQPGQTQASQVTDFSAQEVGTHGRAAAVARSS